MLLWFFTTTFETVCRAPLCRQAGTRPRQGDCTEDVTPVTFPDEAVATQMSAGKVL